MLNPVVSARLSYTVFWADDNTGLDFATVVKLVFSAAEILIGPEFQCLTHIKRQTDHHLHPSSPTLLPNVHTGRLHQRSWENETVPAFGLRFNQRAAETYLLPWEMLLSLHLRDFIQPRRSFTFTGVKLAVMTLAAAAGLLQSSLSAKDCESY